MGLRCPKCNCADVRDIDRPDGSAPVRGSGWKTEKTENHPGYIRRRRRCRYCGHVVITRERIEES